MAIRHTYRLLFLALLFTACTSVQHISKTDVAYTVLSAEHDTTADQEITTMISPYKSELDGKMNEVIANVPVGLTKKKPESTLGNWCTDALLSMTKQKGIAADFAISNYGGLRLPEIAAGPLTRGELYELLPFDNLLVVVEVPANVLDSLFQKIAETEGWPVSEGVKMVIREKKMMDCTIHGKQLDPTAHYKVVMSDYVANGGDGMSELITLPRIQTGMLVRDALIDYAKQQAMNGQGITAVIEGRIVIQP